MAEFTVRSKIPFWKVEFDGINVTKELSRYISSIAVVYPENKPITGTIQVTSPSFIEGMLTEGMGVKIYFGWDRFNMAEMLSGKIVGKPEGQAAEMIGYTITVVDQVVDMTKKEKNRTFYDNPKKTHIIKQILSENGYNPIVDIANDSYISQVFIPMQRKETDLQFIKRCAKEWNCIWWQDKKNFYFIDAAKAHDKGDIIKKKTYLDKEKEYQLNYRLQIGLNNVALLKWKKSNNKGGMAGSPGVRGTDELGKKIDSNDYVFQHLGTYYKLGPAYKELNAISKANIFSLWNFGDIARKKELLKEYFVPITHGSNTHKSESHDPANKMNGYEIEFELNKGDPFLRRPRKALLNSGSIGHRSSDLAGFLFYKGKAPALYHINEVTTSLENGMIITKGIMTA